MSFFQYKKTKNPNPSPIKKMVFGFSCFEENVEPRDDVCVTKHGLKIPNHADHYEGFVARMKAFEFVLTNAAGKTTTETKTIYFSVGDPEIQFTNCPETTQQDKITITGKIAGNNEEASLFINDKEAWLNSYYYFSETYTLSAGSNKFVFRAVNDYGKTVTITKTIIYSPEAT